GRDFWPRLSGLSRRHFALGTEPGRRGHPAQTRALARAGPPLRTSSIAARLGSRQTGVDGLMTSDTRQAVIVDGLRTPFGRAHEQKGAFRYARADELAAHALRALVARNQLDPSLVDDLIV